MKATFVYRRGLPHHRYWGEAFLAGLKCHGIDCQIEEMQPSSPTDLLIVWGVRNGMAIKGQLRAGKPVCVLERGYVGDRKFWTSVSFGGKLNGKAKFVGPFQDGSRWDKLFSHHIKEWQPNPEGYALILGQVPSDQAVANKNVLSWYDEVAARLKRKMKVYFRPHPQAENVFIKNAKKINGNLADALSGAKFTISWNSNSSVDSVLNGIPSIACDEGSMAWRVTGHDLDQDPPMPNRQEWCNWLAWCQWNEDEMRSGECWDKVCTGLTVQ